MKRMLGMLVCIMGGILLAHADGKFPDGTPIPAWFSETMEVNIETLGRKYNIVEHGVANDSTLLQTEQIQAVIDKAAGEGGGVIIIPKGTFLSGALFFKKGTHLHLQEGAVLKGSDDISNFPVLDTRMEGQNLKYFAALVNVNRVDGFTLSGKGTIDGNGLRYWKSFWLRRAVNPKCTNLEELRPRLLLVTYSKDVQISGVTLQNSPFWTSHYYQCQRVKLLNLRILSPAAPVKAPSTDAVDIDVCTDFLIKNCYMSVNDDAVALKGGKGPWADTDPNNGGNSNIIIEDCTYGFCHGALTCGSESIHNRNIILRRCTITKANRLLWLKMRPDTPQKYEYILVEDIKGDVDHVLYVKPWTQFFDLKGRKDIPKSYSNNVTMRNINMECKNFFSVQQADEQYELSDFTFEKLQIKAVNPAYDEQLIRNSVWKKVNVKP
ncbi:MAG: exopolygalacturonase [Bacteroides sp.]|nr:exopolygalacturonase [Bacteroides sp.]